ncbi:hypothetical protein OE88DRAFT_1662931 [Heliocybe sulcata]|uniref:Uncharacterized protein n=1 Tax=Heliocybe sulcata TaxID=5364 RepID=A0A5C3N6J0_9AGAM|nr:hypothetical protein OE88DRAFT_1662931 [Heliocybe sulcata]
MTYIFWNNRRDMRGRQRTWWKSRDKKWWPSISMTEIKPQVLWYCHLARHISGGHVSVVATGS